MRIFGRVVIAALCVAGLIGASAIPTFADEKGNLTDFSSMTAIPVGDWSFAAFPAAECRGRSRRVPAPSASRARST